MSGLRGKRGARCGSRRGGSVGGYLREKVERLRRGWNGFYSAYGLGHGFFVMGRGCVGVFSIDSLVMKKCDAESKDWWCLHELAYLKRMYRHCWVVLAKNISLT